tara:strand:+ start:5912 stop:6220 length:309 start_codon:yes stop_codon:yes gene_type:complete
MFKFLRRNTELEDALNEVELLSGRVKHQIKVIEKLAHQREHWQLLSVELEVAHGILWGAHSKILEGVTTKPNGTVRKFLKISEQALIDCPLYDVNPTPKWTL